MNFFTTQLNELLQSELTVVLQYERHERSENFNSRNGSYNRDFNTAYGILHLIIPRDRNNEFHSPIIPKYERHDDATESTMLKLFQTGLTTSEISNIVEALYEKKYSRGTVSNITNQVIANIDKFKQRPIKSHYAVIYTDATYICLRRDSVAKEAVYIALGITPEGNKEILGYKIAHTESYEVWRELLLDLKDRGLKKVNLFCTDGLAGFSNVTEELLIEKDKYIEALLAAKTEAENRLKQEHLIVENQKFQIEYLKQQINYLKLILLRINRSSEKSLA